MPKGIPAGQAYFTLALNDQVTKKLSTVGTRIANTTKKIAASATRIATAMASVFLKLVKVAAAAATAVVALGAKFAAYGDKFGKMAVRTGVSAEALQELAYAAEISGTNIDQLSQAMFRARRRIGNAAMGTGPAVRALQALGLSATELARMRPEQQFEALVDALAGVGNEAQRNQLAFELFGDNFRQIQPLIDQGVGGISALRDEARRMGLIVSEEDVRRAEELTDAFYRFRKSLEVIAVKIGAIFGTTLTRILEHISELLGTWITKLEEFFDKGEIGFVKFQITAMEVLSQIYVPLAKIARLLPGYIGGSADLVANNMGYAIKLARERLMRLELQRQSEGTPFTPLGTKDTGRIYAERIYDGLPAASTGVLSGFGAAMTSAMNFNKADPKAEEKQMVRLLEEINDNGLIVGAGDGF